MAKDLNGKELGKGLLQDKRGDYVARFVDRSGKRQSKRFKKLQEARKWLSDSTFLDDHSNRDMPLDLTVDAFYEIWIEYVSKMNKSGTADSYRFYYSKHIKQYLGNMLIRDVRQYHCQNIVNKLVDSNYAHSTISIVCTVMRCLFNYAVECDVIMKTPCNIHLKSVVGRAKRVKEALTTSEHKKFLKHIEGHVHENQFRFVLQTGLRVGELIGLKWSDVDYEKRTLKIQRTMKYLVGKNEWRIGTPKSVSGNRTIPLTDEAIRILKCQFEKNLQLSVRPLEYSDFIFVNSSGIPIAETAYYAALDKLCKKIGIKHISMHILRHTFATRCAMSGKMKIKSLQSILGHSSISMTMDYYVHADEEELSDEINKVSNVLNAI